MLVSRARHADHESRDETVAEFLLQEMEPGEVLGPVCGGCLDLNGDNAAVVEFDDQVDLGAVTVAKVEQLIVLLTPRPLLE